MPSCSGEQPDHPTNAITRIERICMVRGLTTYARAFGLICAPLIIIVPTPMRIGVIGCGGIGGVLAATLTRAGADVTPIVGNPKIAAALAAGGYRVRELDGSEWSVPCKRAPLLHASQADAP